MYRFAWEKEASERRGRSRSGATACCISTACCRRSFPAFPRDKRDEVLSLLAVTYATTDAPAGTVDLVFAGGGAIRLEVECIEARLVDLGGAWRPPPRPAHQTKD